jgi:predicted acetyltransferase
MELVLPASVHAASFAEAVEEMRGAGEMGFWEEIGPPESVEEYIQLRNDHARGERLPEGWIPATTYWLIDRNHIIGETNIRHKLTEHLRNVGGQIGYWIRPSRRKQGYGTVILRLALDKAAALGMTDVLITCDETNAASQKIIQANGGVFERAQEMGKGKPKKLLYWKRC